MTAMSLFAELKRRNVFRVIISYLIFAWVLLQISDVLFPAFGLPAWGIKLVATLLVIGFFPALIISWVYELTPEGIKRESQIDRSESMTSQTGRRLDLVTIVMVVIGAGLLIADRLVPESGVVPAPSSDVAGQPIGTPVVAVLPFTATGSDDGGFLAIGLHDDLLTRLAKLDAFKVISRTSMMEYADSSKNMRQIGEELGANFILEGGVLALGERVRINAQLIDAPADEHIWADTYDRQLTAANLFEVQAELAIAIAGQMQTALSESDRALMDEVPTQSIEAYNAYLQGLELIETEGFNEINIQAVIATFEQAVRLDPGFALAWARLSEQRSRLSRFSDDAHIREAALDALRSARALQPELLEVELAWSVYLYHGMFEYERALQVLESLGPRVEQSASALQLKGWLMRRLGRFNEAHQSMLEARRLEPRSHQMAGDVIDMAYLSDNCAMAGRHAEEAMTLAPDSVEVRSHVAKYELECTGDVRRANELLLNVDYQENWQFFVAMTAALSERNYQRVLDLSNTPMPEPDQITKISRQLSQARALRHLERQEDAAAILEKVGTTLADVAKAEKNNADGRIAGLQAWYHAMTGDAEATRDWVDIARRRNKESLKGDRYSESELHFYYAHNLALAGLYEEAVAELRVMFEEPGGSGFRLIDALPEFDSLDGLPAYEELRERFANVR